MELPLKESLQTEGSSATPCVHINIPDDAKLKRLGWATNCLVVFWVLLSLFLTLHVWSCFCVYLCLFWLTLFCLLFLAVFFLSQPFHISLPWKSQARCHMPWQGVGCATGPPHGVLRFRSQRLEWCRGQLHFVKWCRGQMHFVFFQKPAHG